MSEYHKVALGKKVEDAGLKKQVFVDAFKGVNLLTKEYIDRSIWISPMPQNENMYNVVKFFEQRYECGVIVDIRMGSGRQVKGRTRENTYCVIEYADEKSVPRSLKVASKKKAIFCGNSVRIYKAGTKTAINMPSQRRR